MLFPGLNRRLTVLPAAALTLSMGLYAGAPADPEPLPVAASPAAKQPASQPSLQRGRSGGKPRSKAGRPSAPRGLGQPKGIEAVRETAGDLGPRPLAPDRGDLGGAEGADGATEPVFGHPAERQQRLWFSNADGDRSGWISFREAAASMRFDAPRFCVFDVDNDGRFTYPEFSRYIAGESARNRRVMAPTVVDLDTAPRRRSAEQLRAAYDTDSDGAVSRLEFESILRDYDQEAMAFDRGDTFVRLDANNSKTLEIDELGRLASFLNPMKVGRGTVTPVMPGASTVLDLFGGMQDMGDAHPPRIVGPVPPFRRLDLNNDGFVDIEDLERLEGRSFNPVRLKSVLNTLDIDYDGRLSEAEFLSSMTSRRRR